MLRNFLMVLQLLSSIAIVALVLLQRGKGADAGAGFGAGASGTVFGARGARTALSRATAVFAAIFMVNSLALAYMGTRRAAEPASILDEAGQGRPAQQPGTAAPAAPSADPMQIPVPASGGASSETSEPSASTPLVPTPSAPTLPAPTQNP
jgi:preprotein translocase subunit SecG